MAGRGFWRVRVLVFTLGILISSVAFGQAPPGKVKPAKESSPLCTLLWQFPVPAGRVPDSLKEVMALQRVFINYPPATANVSTPLALSHGTTRTRSAISTPSSGS